MAGIADYRSLSESNPPSRRGEGHTYGDVQVSSGNLMQGDFNTIHNHHYSSSKARTRSGSDTTDSNTTTDEKASGSQNAKFIVPRCSTPYFTGRLIQLDQLQDYFSNPPDSGLSRRIVVVVGTGGAGKTQFCLKYAELHQSE